MNVLVDVAALLIVCVLFGVRNGYQITELKRRVAQLRQLKQLLKENSISAAGFDDVDAPTANKRWHAYQFGIQLIIGYFAWRTIGLYSAVLIYGALWWLIFDGIVNRALGKGFWFVGTTAAIDKFIRKLGLPVPFLKLGALAVTIVAYVIEKSYF